MFPSWGRGFGLSDMFLFTIANLCIKLSLDVTAKEFHISRFSQCSLRSEQRLPNNVDCVRFSCAKSLIEC